MALAVSAYLRAKQPASGQGVKTRISFFFILQDQQWHSGKLKIKNKKTAVPCCTTLSPSQDALSLEECDKSGGDVVGPARARVIPAKHNDPLTSVAYMRNILALYVNGEQLKLVTMKKRQPKCVLMSPALVNIHATSPTKWRDLALGGLLTSFHAWPQQHGPD